MRKALTSTKIMKGFLATGIWPLLPSAMDAYMQPSECYVEPPAEHEEDEDEQVDTNAAMPEGEEDCILETQP